MEKIDTLKITLHISLTVLLITFTGLGLSMAQDRAQAYAAAWGLEPVLRPDSSVNNDHGELQGNLKTTNGDGDAPHPFSNYSAVEMQSRQFTDNAFDSFEEAIAGNVAGFYGVSRSGMPGDGANLYLRGPSSFYGNNQPLVVIDGVIFDSRITETNVVPGYIDNALANLNPKDIDNIVFLKDGGSLYGIRGANGVILVTTKRSKGNETLINFSAGAGVVLKPDDIPLMEANDYRSYVNNQLVDSGLDVVEINTNYPWLQNDPDFEFIQRYNNNTNWQDEIFENATIQSYDLNLSGGDAIAKYYVGLGYMNQEGIVKNTSFERYNFRFNADVQILEKLSMHSSLWLTYNDKEIKPFTTQHELNPILSAWLKPPVFAPFEKRPSGEVIPIFTDADEFGFSNPATLVQDVDGFNTATYLFGSTRLDYTFNDMWKVSSLIGINYIDSKTKMFVPDRGIADFQEGEVFRIANEGVQKQLSIYNENRLDFKKTWAEKHRLNASAGFRVSTLDLEIDNGTVFNSPTDEFKSLSSTDVLKWTQVGGNNDKHNWVALFANIGYSLNEKYFLNANVSLDASSKVGSQAEGVDLFSQAWGFFPSLHGGWLISSEDFMESINTVNQLKLRASYSITGLDDIPAVSDVRYNSIGYGNAVGLTRDFIPNPELKWQTNQQFNIGLDATVLGSRLSFSADYYTTDISDMITYRSLDPGFGRGQFVENGGSATKSGLELALDVKVLDGRLKWNIGGNIASWEIDAAGTPVNNDFLPVEEAELSASSESLLAFYGFETNGIYATTEAAANAGLTTANGIPYQAGDVRFVDQDNNGVIDDNDRVEIGNLFPSLTGGIYTTLAYERFSFNVLFDYVRGNDVFNYTRFLGESMTGLGNQTGAVNGRWTVEGDQASLPNAVFNDPRGNAVFSDRWIEDGSFVRLRTVSLSYELPELKFVKNASVTLVGHNLFTISDYLGYSPEFGGSPIAVNQGMDLGRTPVGPSYMLRLNVGL